MQKADNPLDITIRKATEQDSPTIARFNSAMAAETENTTLDWVTIHNGVKSLMQQPQYGFYLVAESRNKIIGCLLITYEWSDWRNGLLWWTQSVYITPEWRRQGVFSQMYQSVKKMAKDDNIAGLRLYVDEHNHNAISTYQSLGMTKTRYQLFEFIFD